MSQRLTVLFCAVGVLIGSCAAAFGESVTVNADQVNLRAQPSTGSAIVATVNRGAQLEVLGRQGGWYRVSVPGTGGEAYVHSILVIEGQPAQAEPPAPSPSPAASSSVPPPRPATVPAAEPARRQPQPPVPAPAASASAVPDRGAFAVGVAAFSVGGGIPSGQFDVSDLVSLRAMATLVSGASLFGAEALYRFPVRESGASVRIQPYAGGGIAIVNVDYGFGSESFTGLLGSGGIFLRFRKNPHWEPYGEVTYVRFGLRGFAEPAVRGVGASFGVHYYF